MALNIPSMPAGTPMEDMQRFEAGQYANQLARAQAQYAPGMLQSRNQLLATKAQFAPQMAQSDYEKAQLSNVYTALQNQMYVPKTQAEIGQARAQAGYLGSETSKNQYLVQHPWMLSTGPVAQNLGGYAAIMSNPEARKALGYGPQVDPNAQTGQSPQQQPGQPSGQQPPQQPGMQPGSAPSPQPQSPMNSMLDDQDANNSFSNPPIPMRPQPSVNGFSAPQMPQPQMPMNAMASPQQQMPQQQMPQQQGGGLAQGMPISSNPIVNAMVNQPFVDQRYKESTANYRDMLTQTQLWRGLPVARKESLIAQGGGMGIDPIVMERQLSSGKTIAQIATENGFDPNNLPPAIYANTAAAITQIQKRQQAQAEVGPLTDAIAAGLAPFSRRFAGYSPSQIMGAITNEDPKKQGAYIGAMSLTPELAMLRSRLGTGQISVEGTNLIINSSMLRAKALNPLMSKEVFEETQKWITEKLNQAVNAANAVGVQPYKSQEQIGGGFNQLNPDSFASELSAAPKKANGESYTEDELVGIFAKKFNRTPDQIRSRAGLE